MSTVRFEMFCLAVCTFARPRGVGDRSFHQLFLHTRERHPTSILFDHEEVTDQPHGESTWFLRSCAASGDYKRMPLVSFNFLHTTGRSTSRVLVIVGGSHVETEIKQPLLPLVCPLCSIENQESESSSLPQAEYVLL